MSNNVPYPFESQRYYAQKPETVVRMQDLWRVINDLKVIWNQVDPTATPGTGTVTSVDLAMPSAFTVSGNPITTAGTITVSGAGTSSDYIDGTGALQTFPSVGTGTVTSVAIAPGTAISVSGSPITTSGTITITNTAPDQTVVLTSGTGISITGTYPNFTITNSSPSSGGTVTSVAASAGTGISITGSPITTSGTLNITNTAPDQTVVLTAGTGISITGTYPNFTITNSSPSSGGTVTSITVSSPLTGGTITTSGSIGIQDAVADGATKGAATFTASDFNSSSGIISIDYANGQRASATDPGFLSAADWNTFNNKQSALSVSITGSGSIANSGTSSLTSFTGSGTTSGTNTGDVTVTDSSTIDFTLAAQNITASAITQMSITSDASGLKLSGDASSPGNNYSYGTNSSGTKGYYQNIAVPLAVFCSSTSTVAQNTTYFQANIPAALSTTITRFQMVCPYSGTIVGAYLFGSWAGTPSGNNHAMYIRLNNTTDLTIDSAFSLNGLSNKTVSTTGLSQAVTAGDLLAIKWVTPATWTTTPTNVIWAGWILVRPNVT